MSVASIQQITNIKKHPNADTLSIGTVLGWQVVFNHTQNAYKDGDLVVYVEIDSVLPDHAEFEFLRTKQFRVRPIRLRGEASNGLCLPIETLGKFGYDMRGPFMPGVDVTETLGAKHYEKPLPATLSGKALGYLPSFIIKTDEENLRSHPFALDELRNREYYIARKDDGSSGTFFVHKGVFGVCSRNLQLAEDENNLFWKLARQYDIEAKIKTYYKDQDIAIQGEVVGPGVNGNNLGLSKHELHLFSIQFLDVRTYATFAQLRDFCNETTIPMVTLIEMGDKFQYNLESLLKIANTLKYPNGSPAEGIVIRSQWPLRSTVLQKEWSGKIINENYKDAE
jgi:RNA ligase (TIGR02306 family)